MVTIEHINLGNSLEEVRKRLSQIDFNKPGIHILVVQPGVGKTHTIGEFLRTQESFLLLTPSHKLIDEEYKKMGAKHWEGLSSNLCKRYSRVKRLKELGVPIKVICEIQHCKTGECKYWKQFDTRKAVSPIHFLPTNRVQYRKKHKGKDKGDFRFDVLVADESFQLYNTISYNEERIKEAIHRIYGYYPNDEERDSLINILLGGDFNIFDMYLEEHGGSINFKKSATLKKAIENNNLEDVELINSLNLFEIKKYLYYENASFYDIHEEGYPEPLFYHILDISRQGIPVILLDASFDEDAVALLLWRYQIEDEQIPRDTLINKDIEPFDDLKITIYESNLQNKELTIHRMDRENYYYRKTFFDYRKDENGKTNAYLTENGKTVIEQLRKYIQRTKRKGYSVGVITYMDICKEFEELTTTDYFGNLRGSNKIKDVDVLFIIGTPQNNKHDITTGYNNLALFNHKAENIGLKTYTTDNGKHFRIDNETGEIDPEPLEEKKPNPHYDRLSDGEFLYSITDYDFNQSENEKYQAVHRARLFINDKIVYIFGDVPEKIREEFTMKTYTKEETRKHFNREYKGVAPLALDNYINTYYTKGEPTVLEIAQKLRLYKRRDDKKYNTPFITTILDVITKRDMKRINNGINEGLKTAKSIKRKYRTLEKIEENFIEDCIYYNNKGSYILLD